MLKQEIPFCSDSFDNHTSKTLKNYNILLKDLIEFTNSGKDLITDETIELLEPYLQLRTPKDHREVFVGPVAMKASAALAGLCEYIRSMRDYHNVSKALQPKLQLIQAKMEELDKAEINLAAAEDELKKLCELQDRLRKKVDTNI